MERASLIGERFTRLLVTDFSGSGGRGAVWTCECDCGNVTTASTGKLRAGHKRSCGCLRDEVLRANGAPAARLRWGHAQAVFVNARNVGEATPTVSRYDSRSLEEAMRRMIQPSSR